MPQIGALARTCAQERSDMKCIGWWSSYSDHLYHANNIIDILDRHPGLWAWVWMVGPSSPAATCSEGHPGSCRRPMAPGAHEVEQ